MKSYQGLCQIYLCQWQILIQRTGLAVQYNATLSTVPLDLTSGSGFATDSYMSDRNIKRLTYVDFLCVCSKQNLFKRKSLHFVTFIFHVNMYLVIVDKNAITTENWYTKS